MSSHEQFLGEIHSRKLLLHSSIPSQPPSLPPAAADTNALMVLSVLSCAVICSVALNYIIRFALASCTHFSGGDSSSAQLPTTAGINQKALRTFPIVKYDDEQHPAALDGGCAICLSDFGPGERVRILPKCNHGFHVKCVDKWLKSHSSCPTCRQCLIETCQNINSFSNPEMQQISIVNIFPLQSEGIISIHGI